MQQIFKDHFEVFKEQYEEKYSKTYGKFRLDRITEVVTLPPDADGAPDENNKTTRMTYIYNDKDYILEVIDPRRNRIKKIYDGLDEVRVGKSPDTAVGPSRAPMGTDSA